MSDTRPADGTLSIDYRLDDYRIVSVLGQGGFGVTYKAIDERLERTVAIKEYLPRQFATREADATVRARSDADAETFEWGRRRFVDEARALAKFKHPNIVAVNRYLEANGTAYLVMDYEEGRDFEKWLVGRSEPPSEDMIVRRILLPVLDGLEKIHAQGLLHRDIKPENIFIRQDGSPVVIDFGASRAQSGDSAPMTSIISAGYSPFVASDGTGEGQGPWSDLYALAGTLYRAVVGRAPTDAISRYQAPRSPGRRSGGWTLLASIAQRDRSRPGPQCRGATQSADELRRLVGGTPAANAAPEGATRVRSAAETVVMPTPRASRRWPLWASGMVLLAVGAGGYYYLSMTTAPVAPAIVQTPAVAPPIAQSSTADIAAAQVAEPVKDEPPPEPTEDDIANGLPMSEGDRAYRTSQIGGALLAYVSNRQKFDACLKSGCADQGMLMTKVQEALDGYSWKQGAVAGELQVANPRLTSREGCAFLLDLVETLTGPDGVREQTRSYCTTNGFDRVLQHSGKIVGI
ncbi:MAG: protein kinase [Gammaproteobacteria bacterium]|nr:protein kinase [Gammaproteobacteria bacterium]